MSHHLWTLIGQTPVPVENPLDWRVEDNRVAETWVGQIRVSTVFLGLHTNMVGPPEVFETMVFEGEEIKGQLRYATWSEAEESHRLVVLELRDRFPNEKVTEGPQVVDE